MGSKTPTVYVCAGSDCRERKADARKLRGAIDGVATEVPVGCQKLCDGPVVGVEVDDTVQWFGAVRGKKARRALVGLLETGAVPPELKALRSKKRAGKLR